MAHVHGRYVTAYANELTPTSKSLQPTLQSTFLYIDINYILDAFFTERLRTLTAPKLWVRQASDTSLRANNLSKHFDHGSGTWLVLTLKYFWVEINSRHSYTGELYETSSAGQTSTWHYYLRQTSAS